MSQSSNIITTAEKYLLNYYYVSTQDMERIDKFRVCTGDSEKTLITQYIRGWISRNRDYYLNLARLDAKARGISFREWGETVVAKRIDDLPKYLDEKMPKPDEENPLRGIQIDPDAIRKPINYVWLARQNLALLKVGIHYDGDSAVRFVSRIVKEHLATNWDKKYQSQVDANDFANWI
ncbi:hypothetical protein ACQ4M3_13340 [Leptolyngbya sp. AN03gr2]|uniref:hypothetical protein n=1 Tax=unclassified Leptolyngbya TaxID=2650499 RepID=UPI003D318B5C